MLRSSGHRGASAVQDETVSRREPERAEPERTSWPRATISAPAPVPADRAPFPEAEEEHDFVQAPASDLFEKSGDVRTLQLVTPAVFDAVKEDAVPRPQTLPFPRKEQVRQVLRFAKGEMMLHWAIAVPFLVCFTTGIALKLFYPLNSPSPVPRVLSIIHRIGGCALAVLPALAIARNWRDYKVHIYNVKIGFSWTIDDLKWLFLVGPATVSKRIVLPEQRKFNAAERLNFMMVMVTYPVFVTTGFFLWWHGVDHFIPWLIHISMSLVAPLLMLGHIYMAVVNPSTRVGLSGMFTGRVDREWAKHHYRRWYQENFEEDGTAKERKAT